MRGPSQTKSWVRQDEGTARATALRWEQGTGVLHKHKQGQGCRGEGKTARVVGGGLQVARGQGEQVWQGAGISFLL